MGKNSFFPIYIPWTRHPERDEKYIEEMRSELGDIQLRQEIFCLGENTKIETNYGVMSIHQLYDRYHHVKVG